MSLFGFERFRCDGVRTLPLLQASFRKPAAGGAGAGAGKDKKGAKFELTEEQKQEIREAFDLFDTDGSGAFLSGAFEQCCGSVSARLVIGNSIDAHTALLFLAFTLAACRND